MFIWIFTILWYFWKNARKLVHGFRYKQIREHVNKWLLINKTIEILQIWPEKYCVLVAKFSSAFPFDFEAIQWEGNIFDAVVGVGKWRHNTWEINEWNVMELFALLLKHNNKSFTCLPNQWGRNPCPHKIYRLPCVPFSFNTRAIFYILHLTSASKRIPE